MCLTLPPQGGVQGGPTLGGVDGFAGKQGRPALKNTRLVGQSSQLLQDRWIYLLVRKVELESSSLNSGPPGSVRVAQKVAQMFLRGLFGQSLNAFPGGELGRFRVHGVRGTVGIGSDSLTAIP